MAGNVAPNLVTNGLVLCYDPANTKSFVSGSTTLFDLTSSKDDGSLINGPTFNSANGGSIVFDGVDDYVLCPKQTSLVSATQFTMCAWMKRNLSNSLVFIGQIETLSNDIAFELWNDGNVYFEVGNGSNSYGVTSNNSTLWQYLTMVFDGTQTGNSNRLKTYINGSLLTLSYVGIIPPSTGTVNNNLNVGAYLPGSNYSNGNISQVQIYNRALSAAEVLQNYNASKRKFGL